MMIKNRVGRILEVPDDLGNYMLKNDGATLYEPEVKPLDETPERNPLECPYCQKVCGSQIGYTRHTTACKKKALSSQS